MVTLSDTVTRLSHSLRRQSSRRCLSCGGNRVRPSALDESLLLCSTCGAVLEPAESQSEADADTGRLTSVFKRSGREFELLMTLYLLLLLLAYVASSNGFSLPHRHLGHPGASDDTDVTAFQGCRSF